MTRSAVIAECQRLEERQGEGETRSEEPRRAEVPDTDNAEGTEEVMINPAYPDQPVVIGKDFSKECRGALIHLLSRNIDVFAWQLTDMTGVPRHIIKHHLNLDNADTQVA